MYDTVHYVIQQLQIQKQTNILHFKMGEVMYRVVMWSELALNM